MSNTFVGRLRGSRLRLLLLGAVTLLVIGTLVAAVVPFAIAKRTADGSRNGARTAVQIVQRRSLTAQQSVTGTLGYEGAWTVAVPAGTSAAELQQAMQQVNSAYAAYIAVRVSQSGDEQALATAEATLQAALLKESSDCAGARAAESATSFADTAASSSSASPAGAAGACLSSVQAAQLAKDAVHAARLKAAADRAQLAPARTTLARARRGVETARLGAAGYEGPATYTKLPAPGDVIRAGETLYSVNGSATLLLYGLTPAWRSLAAGVSPGQDVAELNANLRALGFGATVGDRFTRSTEQAIKELQRAHGLSLTTSLPLGSVVFEPSAVRVTAVTPTVGESVQPGPIMTLSSTRHEVSIQLDVSRQSQVKEGDHVAISLPNNSTTPGVVSFVGKVATISSAQGSSGNAPPGSPSIPVHVRLLHSDDAGTLDQAPVNVLITTARVRNVLVVPVTALVALAGGGYALDEVTGKDTHELIPVTPGLFDDQQGLVQVEGPRVEAGQRVVVSAS